MQWHKTTEIYSLRVLEVRSAKSVSLSHSPDVRGAEPSRGSGTESISWPLQVLLLPHALVLPWRVATSLQGQQRLCSLFHPHIAFSSVCFRAPLPLSFGILWRHLGIIIQDNLPISKFLTLSHLKRSAFPQFYNIYSLKGWGLDIFFVGRGWRVGRGPILLAC